MLGPVEYVSWLAVISVEICSIVFILKSGALRKYFTLLLYLSACLANSVGCYSIIQTSGYASEAYSYYYYYSDFLLTISLYFVLMSLYSHVFSQLGVGQIIRIFAILLLGATSGISYYMVAASSDRMITHFVAELGQNLFFVGVVLTYLLWGAMVKLKENRARLMQLVLSLGVYVSLSSGSYALMNMYPRLALWHYFMPLIDLWLPLSWTFTFLKVPEDRLIVTARVVAPHA